jgi:hypothetical protein
MPHIAHPPAVIFSCPLPVAHYKPNPWVLSIKNDKIVLQISLTGESRSIILTLRRSGKYFPTETCS